MSRLVLASSSSYRKSMLEAAGLHVICRAPGVDESLYTSPRPGQRAREIVDAKVAAVPLGEGEIAIAADQVAYDPHRDVVFGKPADVQAQIARLMELAGSVHELHTAWTVWSPQRRIVGMEVARVHLRGDLKEEEVRAYAETGDGAGCAGGYTAEGRGSFMIERIEGDLFGVIGLPLYPIHRALRVLHG